MAVPAALARDLIPLHRAEAREDVLEHPRFDVVGAGEAIGGGWSFVEHPQRLAVTLSQALLEDVVLAPEVQHVMFECSQVDLCRNRAVHQSSVGTPVGAGSVRRDEANAPRYHPPWPPKRPTQLRCCRFYADRWAVLPPAAQG